MLADRIDALAGSREASVTAGPRRSWPPGRSAHRRRRGARRRSRRPSGRSGHRRCTGRWTGRPTPGSTVSGRPSLARRIAEHGDRGDVIRHVGRKRVVEPDGRDGHRADDVDHRRTLRVAAQHQPGVGAGVDHVLDVGAGVVGAAGGRKEVEGGRVVDRVGADRPAADLAAQRVDERAADVPQARRIVGAAGEDRPRCRGSPGPMRSRGHQLAWATWPVREQRRRRSVRRRRRWVKRRTRSKGTAA